MKVFRKPNFVFRFHFNQINGYSMRFFLWPSLLIFGLFSNLSAQSETLSLAQCLDLAAQNSFRLRASDEEVQVVGSAYQTDRTRYFPHFSAELAHSQLFYSNNSYRQQVGQAVVDWGLGDWWLKTAEFQKKNLLAAEAERQQISLEVTQRVAMLYIAILQKQVNRDLLSSRMNLLNEHAQVSKALWLAGTRTQFDVLQTESAIDQLHEQMLAAELETDNLRQELARLLDLPDYRTLQLREFPQQMIEVDSLANLTYLPLQQNPLLQSLEFQYQAEQLRLREVRASLLPHLQFTGGYVVDRDPTGEGNYWQMGAGLQFPLFQWGLSKFQQQEIRAGARALQFQQAEIKRDLQIQLDQINEKLRKLKEIYQVQEKRLAANQQAFQLATANYQAGLITNLEYLTAQKEVAENQLALQETSLGFSLNLIGIYTLTNQTARIAELQGGR